MPAFTRHTLTLVFLLVIFLPCHAQNRSPMHRIYVFVIDGLRPDQITPQKMPNLYRFQQNSVSYRHAHSAPPTVTRVNGATLSTGVYPATHGIVSNSLDLPSFSSSPLSTGDEESLLKKASLQNGHILLAPSLSEILARHGKNFVAISSGSTGGATLLAPEARHGVATVINAGLDQGKRLAYPQSVEDAIRTRFGYTPAHEGTSSVEWTEKILRDYVIPVLHPDVVIDWITEPDTSQHKYGIGSPEALQALAAVDRNFGAFLSLLAQRSETQSSDIILTADHGFIDTPDHLALDPLLQAAHLQASKDVGILIDGQMASFFLRSQNRSIRAAQLKSLVSVLGDNPHIDALFTRSSNRDDSCRSNALLGHLPGTFAIEALHLCRSGGADLVATTAWSNKRNRFGEPGTGANFSRTSEAPSSASHGGLSSWAIHIPLILHGPEFRPHCRLNQPAANIDLPATLLYLLKLPHPRLEGRTLSEALRSADKRTSFSKRRILHTAIRQRKYTLTITRYQGESYIDQSTAN